MAAAYTSRDIVEDFLRYKLRNCGAAWRVPPRRRTDGLRRRNAAASTSSLSWRAQPAMMSHRVSPGSSQQGEVTVLSWQRLTCPPYLWKDPGLASPRLQVVLRCAGDELERRYRGDLSAQMSVLLQCDGGGAERWRGLTAELFRDGVNWGRIVAMMELGGALCTEVVRTGRAGQVDDIAGWMEESLDSPPLRGWIEDNGGWDAFVELYGESRPPAGFWSLRTVFGLAVLGAAGLTLGALFTQR